MWIRRLDRSISQFGRRTSHIVASQCRWVYAESTQPPPLRRSRQYVGKIKVLELSNKRGERSGSAMQHPYAHGEANAEEYFQKMTLSPWVPMPDSAARKMMDLARVGPNDYHVDLGSGDGRVNFHAIDCGVGRSLGVDIDEHIVQVARDRLQKRHPPPNLEFVVADLLKDTEHPVWLKIQEATVITMYFATEALRVFRPVLEAKLVGRKCKILTCGYEMPGWISRQFEVVNGMQLFLYEWGTPISNEEERESLQAFMDEDISRFLPPQVKKKPLENEKFAGMNVIDHTNQHPIRGYNPNFEDVIGDDGDADWDAEMEAEQRDMEMHKEIALDMIRKPKPKKSPCSKSSEP
jgi:Methyltransferase domain